MDLWSLRAMATQPPAPPKPMAPGMAPPRVRTGMMPQATAKNHAQGGIGGRAVLHELLDLGEMLDGQGGLAARQQRLAQRQMHREAARAVALVARHTGQGRQGLLEGGQGALGVARGQRGLARGHMQIDLLGGTQALGLQQAQAGGHAGLFGGGQGAHLQQQQPLPLCLLVILGGFDGLDPTQQRGVEELGHIDAQPPGQRAQGAHRGENLAVFDATHVAFRKQPLGQRLLAPAARPAHIAQALAD